MDVLHLALGHNCGCEERFREDGSIQDFCGECGSLLDCEPDIGGDQHAV